MNLKMCSNYRSLRGNDYLLWFTKTTLKNENLQQF